MLKGKTVLLGITGGIAAYKAAYLASALLSPPTFNLSQHQGLSI